MCKCLVARIQQGLVTSPYGPTIVIISAPSKSPESLTGGLSPKVKLSVFETSTCVYLRNGPNNLTLFIVF